MLQNIYLFWAQNVLILSVQNMFLESKMFPILYTTNTHVYNSSVNIGPIFFSSSDMHQSHHLLSCQATGIISSFNIFKCFTFFKFNTRSQKSDKNNTIRIIFIKIVIKINIFKINFKNTHFNTIKYRITRIFIKVEYVHLLAKQ